MYCKYKFRNHTSNTFNKGKYELIKTHKDRFVLMKEHRKNEGSRRRTLKF